jgi:hypothetical protein
VVQLREPLDAATQLAYARSSQIRLSQKRRHRIATRAAVGAAFQLREMVEQARGGHLGIEAELLRKDARNPLSMERHNIDRPETEFTVTVHGKPAKAGIDPWNQLVDRSPDDNLTDVVRR